MNRCNWVWLACWLVAAPVVAAEMNSEALVTGDYVRLRAEPSLTAPQLGYLYKNLRVHVLEKSANTGMVDGKAQYWYRVRQDDVEGWCSGAFLSFDIPDAVTDTYAAPAEMDWFYARYGSSTGFQDNTFNPDSFTVDEYRKLMAATEASGANTSAPLVLKLSIYRHLSKHPDDPKYRYLKAKLYSPDFLRSMLGARQFDLLALLPGELAKQSFGDWFRRSPQAVAMRGEILGQIPESEAKLRGTLAGYMLANSARESDARQDAELVRLAVADDGLLLKYAGPWLRDDFETVMTAVKNNHSAVQWVSDRLKADVRIRDVVGKKAIRKDVAPEGGLIVDKVPAAGTPEPATPSASGASTNGLSIRAPITAENGAVVPVTVGIDPPLEQDETLTVTVQGNRACELRLTGNILLSGFGARFRLPGDSDVRAVVTRKHGERIETTRHIGVSVGGAVPAGGTDSRNYRVRTRENEVLVLVQNPMGRSRYVDSVVLSFPQSVVRVEATPWFSGDPIISIKGPNVSGEPTVQIGIAEH